MGNPEGYGVLVDHYINNNNTCKMKNPHRGAWWFDNWTSIRKKEEEIDLNDDGDKAVWNLIKEKLDKLKLKTSPNGIMTARYCSTPGGKKRKKTRRKKLAQAGFSGSQAHL